MLSLKQVGVLLGIGTLAFAATFFTVTKLNNSNTENAAVVATDQQTISVAAKEFVNTALTDQETELTVTAPKLTASEEKVTNKVTVKKIKPLKLVRSRTLALFGEVSENALSLALGVSELNKQSSTEPIFMVIDSPGGSVLHGAHLISAMQASKAPVYTICINLCASMAAMIHQYGTERYATDRAIIMFHPASVGSQGDVDRIYSFIKAIQKYTNKIEAEVAKRMGRTFDQYKALTVNELWIDAEDALAENIVDKLVTISLKDSPMQRLMVPQPAPEETEAKKLKRKAFTDIQWICNHCKF